MSASVGDRKTGTWGRMVMQAHPKSRRMVNGGRSVFLPELKKGRLYTGWGWLFEVLIQSY